MAIPGMSGAAPMDPNYSASDPNQSTEANMDPLFNPDPQVDLRRQMNEDNYFNGKAAKERAENFIKANADNIVYTSKWFSANYITFTPPQGSKMTYGQLRGQLGIPPGVIRATNGGDKSIEDKKVIDKPVKVTVDQIGWYEMRMDEMEAADARCRRDHGDPYGGYDRNFDGSGEVTDMIKKHVKNQN